MESFDSAVSIFVNGFAHRWWGVDRLATFLAGNELVKGVPVLATFFFAWFQLSGTANSQELTQKRRILLHTLLVCIPAVLLTRALAWALPFRARPNQNPELHLRIAHTFDTQMLIGWSSFPSDHAVLLFALATGMFLVHRKVGLFLYVHAIVVLLPRLFLGIHYPSDLLVGALLGVGFGYTAAWYALRVAMTRPAMYLMKLSSGFFYACFFFLTQETAQMYDPLRHAAAAVWRLVR